MAQEGLHHLLVTLSVGGINVQFTDDDDQIVGVDTATLAGIIDDVLDRLSIVPLQIVDPKKDMAIKHLRDAKASEDQQRRRLSFTQESNRELLGRYKTDLQMEGMRLTDVYGKVVHDVIA